MDEMSHQTLIRAVDIEEMREKMPIQFDYETACLIICRANPHCKLVTIATVNDNLQLTESVCRLYNENACNYVRNGKSQGKNLRTRLFQKKNETGFD
jgi:hypothetical protein